MQQKICLVFKNVLQAQTINLDSKNQLTMSIFSDVLTVRNELPGSLRALRASQSRHHQQHTTVRYVIMVYRKIRGFL